VKAFAARGKLACSPTEAVPLLKKRLKPVPPADLQAVRQLLADLDSDRFADRERGRTGLEELGDRAAAALRQALTRKPPLELHPPISALLKRLSGPVVDPETLRAVRAVAVLEDVGTADARRVLDALAKGEPDARLTREAKAALRRLTLGAAR